MIQALGQALIIGLLSLSFSQVFAAEQLTQDFERTQNLNRSLLESLFPIQKKPSATLGPKDFEPQVIKAGRKYQLPPSLLRALIKVESNFNPEAVSNKGCIGLTQLHPETARELKVNPWDPSQNIMGGAAYLRQMLDRFGRIDHALWAYNAGPGMVEKNLPPETQRYIPRVLREWLRQSRLELNRGLDYDQ